MSKLNGIFKSSDKNNDPNPSLTAQIRAKEGLRGTQGRKTEDEKAHIVRVKRELGLSYNATGKYFGIRPTPIKRYEAEHPYVPHPKSIGDRKPIKGSRKAKATGKQTQPKASGASTIDLVGELESRLRIQTVVSLIGHLASELPEDVWNNIHDLVKG